MGMKLAGVLRASIETGFREIVQPRGIPLTPSPSPSLGEGSRCLSRHAAYHCDLQRSLECVGLQSRDWLQPSIIPAKMPREPESRLDSRVRGNDEPRLAIWESAMTALSATFTGLLRSSAALRQGIAPDPRPIR